MRKKDQTISCPSCNWKPDGGAYWKCLCGHTWDVFRTGGQCPSCMRVWEKIQCVPRHGGCNTWSPHLDWYGDLNGWLESELDHLKEEQKERRGSRS